MKRILFFSLFFVTTSTLWSQITNGQLNYELRIDTWRQTCDNDGLSADDNEIRIGLTSDANTGGTATWTSGGSGASCGGNNYVRRWQSDAPAILTTTNLLMYYCNTRNPVSDLFTINYSSWEEDGAPDCDPAGDACQASGTYAYTFRSAAKTACNWWGYTGTSNGSYMTGGSGDFFAKTVWRYTYGTACGSALNFGVLTSGVTYSHINTNRVSPSGASADMGYTNVGGNASSDVYYQFTISAPSTVVMSTNNAGTNFDTYMRFYSNTTCGTQLAFNDDFGASTSSQITMDLCAGTYAIQVEGFSTNAGDFNLSVVATALAFNGGTIAGIANGANICYGADPGAFTSAAAAASGVPTITYQWESSVTSAVAGFSNIGGATATTYDPGTLTQTTWFRRRATDGCGAVAYSNVIQVNVSTGLSTVGLSAGDYIWYGGTSTDWTTASNWFIYNGSGLTLAGTPPTLTNNVFIPSISGCVANIPNTLNNTCNALDVTLQTGGQLNIGSGSILNVNDSWYNNSGNATFVSAAAGGRVTFTTNALGTREISGNTSTTFADLTTNYAGYLEVDVLTTVTGTLNMNGNFLLNNRLVLGTSSASTGTLTYAGTGWMSGASYFRRYFAASTNSGNTGLFPFGAMATSFYRGAQFDYTAASTGGWIEGRFVETPLSLYNGLPILNDAGVDINNYMNEGYWEMTEGGGLTGGTYSLTLNRNGINTVTTAANLRIIKSPGPAHSSWVANGTHGTVTATTVSRTGMSGFSWFVISSNTGNPLPVELSSFNVTCNTQAVDLNWTTASEVNSDQFVIDRSSNGIDWVEIGRVDAAGNSNAYLSYAFTDPMPLNGYSYYRLRQIDINGEFTIYDPSVVQCSIENGAIRWMLYPNPHAGEFTLRVNATERESGDGYVEVTDMMGRSVFIKNISLKAGENVFYMAGLSLPDGIYNLSIYSGAQTMGSLRMMMKK